MQKVIFFFIRSKNFLLFCLLFSISIYLTIQTHSFHSTKYINATTSIVGGIQNSKSSVTYYFTLKKENEQLQNENAYLREVLQQEKLNEKIKDSVINGITFDYEPARVISNNYTKSKNILTINKGANEGVHIDMGVVSSNGIVGIVNKVSKNYATVQSVLNTQSQINAKLKKTHHFGILVWEDIRDPYHANLIDIPRHTDFEIGDTIVTGGKSTIFPEGIPVGTIDSYELEEINNAFVIRVKLFTDMTSLHSVYLIENKDYDEIITLEKETNGRNE